MRRSRGTWRCAPSWARRPGGLALAFALGCLTIPPAQGAEPTGGARLLELRTASAARTAGEALPPDARQILGPPRGRPLEGEALSEKTERVAHGLRCPVCQGLSIADSPETLARNMRQQVQELVAEGYSRDQIYAYFEASYGEFVLLEPKLEGINWLVWLAPALALLLGATLVRRSLRRMTRPADGDPDAGKGPKPSPAAAVTPSAVDSEVDPELLPYLSQARRLAYGEHPPQEPGDA